MNPAQQNRQQLNACIQSMQEDMKKGPVEILSGPAKGLTVKDDQTFDEYRRLMTAWFKDFWMPARGGYVHPKAKHNKLEKGVR